MASTASILAAGGGVSLFYYLKIGGLPYYFTCVANPASSSFGAGAWTLPTGYTAVPGMMLPNDAVEQRIPDIVGGIAEAQRIRITLTDFTARDSGGEYEYLSRLFAPGRISAAGTVPELETTIFSGDDAGSQDFRVRNCTANIGANGYVYVNGECIGVETPGGGEVPDDSGRVSMTFDTHSGAFTPSARQLFPCYAGFPAPCDHRVSPITSGSGLVGDGIRAGLPGRSPTVTDEPITLVGRMAAFYIGHFDAAGAPCTEAETMCLVLGRIVGMDYGETGGQYEIEVQGVLDDLSTSPCMPQLGRINISKNQICLYPIEWRKMRFSEFLYNDASGSTEGALIRWRYLDITLDETNTPESVHADWIFTPEYLCGSINKALNDAYYAKSSGDRPSHVPIFMIDEVDGERKFTIKETAYGVVADQHRFEHEFVNGPHGSRGGHRSIGLMGAMGFESPVVANVKVGEIQKIQANRPIATVMIPISGLHNDEYAAFNVDAPPPDVSISVGRQAVENHGFISAGQDGGVASIGYVRFGDGTLAKLYESQPDTAQLRTSDRSLRDIMRARTTDAPVACYYVEEGGDPFVEQVYLLPSDSGVDAHHDIGTVLGTVLASRERPIQGAEGNTLDRTAHGMGWRTILHDESFQTIARAEFGRVCVIDSKTTFKELFDAPAREYGWFMVWDPAIDGGKVSVRRVGVPTEAAAVSPDFSESNRIASVDATRVTIDQTMIRAAWHLRWGYDHATKKFACEQQVVDDFVQSTYAGAGKTETIEDKTLANRRAASGTVVLAEIIRRSYFYRQPWSRCRRSMQLTGLMLSPGSVHQIVDNRIPNPFTGHVGITDADRVYGLLTSVSANPATGTVEIEFVINRQDPASKFRMWSPTGLVDFAASSNGYNTATGVITMAQRYSSDGTSDDGIDFDVGDKVIAMTRDNDATVPYFQATTIAAKAADGSTLTVASGLPAFSSTRETIIVLDDYAQATTARKAEVAFQGGESGIIDDTAGATNNLWS